MFISECVSINYPLEQYIAICRNLDGIRDIFQLPLSSCTPHNKFTRLLPSHSGAANDYQFGRMALVVSGMSCLPGDGITLWSWRPLCDQLTSVRSLNNYSLVTTSAWSPGHCITGHCIILMFISLPCLNLSLLSCQTSDNYDLICELSVD